MPQDLTIAEIRNLLLSNHQRIQAKETELQRELTLLHVLQSELEKKSKNVANLKAQLHNKVGRRPKFGEITDQYVKSIIKEGREDLHPEFGDTLVLEMTGILDGSVFESTRFQNGNPKRILFAEDSLIPGLTKCVESMRLGERCKVRIPRSMTMNATGKYMIADHSTLDYDLELLVIQKSRENEKRQREREERKRLKELEGKKHIAMMNLKPPQSNVKKVEKITIPLMTEQPAKEPEVHRKKLTRETEPAWIPESKEAFDPHEAVFRPETHISHESSSDDRKLSKTEAIPSSLPYGAENDHLSQAREAPQTSAISDEPAVVDSTLELNREAGCLPSEEHAVPSEESIVAHPTHEEHSSAAVDPLPIKPAQEEAHITTQEVAESNERNSDEEQHLPSIHETHEEMPLDPTSTMRFEPHDAAKMSSV